jgi:M6 family metalloprotease-like protein
MDKMKNKKGLSNVIVAVLLIAFVMAITIIVWVFVKNFVSEETERLSVNDFLTNIKIENVYLEDDLIIVDVKQDSAQGNLEGIKFIFYNNTDSSDEDNLTSFKGVEGRRFYFILNKLKISNINKISIAPIYKSSSGELVFGDILDTFEIEETEFCISDCEERECGNNGCGGSCGSCLEDEECIEGVCEEDEIFCQDECDFENQKICFNQSYYEICGNYDFDSCLEWSDNLECSSEQRCYLGSCITQKVLKSLVVITNFANTNFYESPEGEYGAINTIQELEDYFIETNEHWLWMSQGIQKMEWDILEITLDEYFTEDAFSNSWTTFREEVVKEVKKHIEESEYDYDENGIMDVVFILVASDGNQVDLDAEKYLYLIGGHMINEGAHTVVATNIHDTPEGRNVGNFNHEIGHCLDNPDLYGDYDTLGYLSLMSDSWQTPAGGFSTYEKDYLEWVKPLEIIGSRKDILLLPAEENLQSVKILTDDPKEYFLVEYRKKTESGWGSALGYPNYNGLAIYHVDDNRRRNGDNREFPPLIYLEPADGENEFPSSPEESDFWFPDNSASSGIFEAKKWDSSEIIFRIENLRWSGEGILFDINF